MAATQLHNMSPHHYALVDFIVENAHDRFWRGKACAAFGITPSYLSIVTRSDVFREEYFKRLSSYREGVGREIQAQQMLLVQKAYERLLQVIEDEATDDTLVLDIANTTMKNLGFAPSPGAAPQYSKETEITRTSVRELAPGVLESARITYKKVTASEQLLTAVNE